MFDNFTQANIAWKLALVVKGLAPQTLLESFDTERLPVITQMLAATSQLYTHLISRLKPEPENTVPTSDEEDRSGWYKWRNDALEQYGVNYRYSSIVHEERAKTPLNEEIALAHAWKGYEGTKTLRAGDRAPDAPGLVLNGNEATLFDLLSPSKHTILIFSTVGKSAHAINVVRAALKYPLYVVQMFLVGCDNTEPVEGARLLLDAQGCAHTSYLVAEGSTDVIIIRPDGFIGGIVEDAEGLDRYFSKILKI